MSGPVAFTVDGKAAAAKTSAAVAMPAFPIFLPVRIDENATDHNASKTTRAATTRTGRSRVFAAPEFLHWRGPERGAPP